jgi:hypothetical protein
MDVYLVPVGPLRYELYCEIPDEPVDPAGGPPEGFIKRQIHRFREMLAEAERERRTGAAQEPARGWAARVRATTLRWVAHAVAEQRLLWHLRSQETACLHFPDDTSEADGIRELREQLGRDFKKHRNWLAVHSVLLVVTTPFLFWLPGPNIIGYYFLFRAVGHFLSLRGARKGLNETVWTYRPCEPLTELRRMLTLDPALREPRLHAVAQALRLEHLVTFFERSAVSV